MLLLFSIVNVCRRIRNDGITHTLEHLYKRFYGMHIIIVRSINSRVYLRFNGRVYYTVLKKKKKSVVCMYSRKIDFFFF